MAAPVCVSYDAHAAANAAHAAANAAAAEADDGAGAPLSGALHVAPMLAVTDRHFRQLCRLASRRAVLWSEMVHADAVLHNAPTLLPFDRAFQQPCVLQLGGAAPATLARAAEIGASAEYGYDEINLNVRCCAFALALACACVCACVCARASLRRQPSAPCCPSRARARTCVLSACCGCARACAAACVRAQCGCPSGKVCHKKDSSMCFGARLMLDPEHTGECLRCVSAAAACALCCSRCAVRHALGLLRRSAALARSRCAAAEPPACAARARARRMVEAVDVPVSVKCRVRASHPPVLVPQKRTFAHTHMRPLTGRCSLSKTQMGVDNAAEYEDLVRFVETVTAASGVRRVVVHARAALLKGISPAANRRVPPLRHECVHALKADFPTLGVTLNGGLESLAAARAHLARGLDGVMLGRAVQRNPLLLTRVDGALFGDFGSGDADANATSAAAGVIAGYREYVERAVAEAAAAAAAGAAPAFAPQQVRQRAERHLGIAAVAKAARRLDGRGAAAAAGALGLQPCGGDADADADAEAEAEEPCAEADG
jgi:tRNA-dihydrouridine synthase